MRALTLWQPWATLVAHGYKTIETRSWKANYCGPLAIHAAKKFNKSLYALCLTEPFQECLAEIGHANPGSLPLGCIVAKVDLVRCVPTETMIVNSWSAFKHSQFEDDFGDYSLNRYGWIFQNIQRLKKPLPARGSQGIWNWSQPYFLRWIEARSQEAQQ